MLKLSIKSKLLLMLLSVSLVAVGVITALAFQSGKRALTGRIFDQLTSVRASKADQIETYLESVKSQVKMFGEDLMISQAAQHFSAAFEALDQQSISPDWDARVDEYYRSEFLPRLQENVEGRPVFETYRPTQAATRHLQYHYLAANPHPVGKKHELVDPADGSRYSAVHAEYHPIFRNLAKEFGYYDIFLIDPRSGTIVYSVYKETDFATSLRDGPYSNTNLAALVQTVRETPDRGFVRMIDFAPYRPSYAAPAAFVATPIYDGSRNVGVLAMQLPVDEINRIMTGGRSWQRDGLGASGETYLVGPDRLMRSVSRFLVDDPEG